MVAVPAWSSIINSLLPGTTFLLFVYFIRYGCAFDVI